MSDVSSVKRQFQWLYFRSVARQFGPVLIALACVSAFFFWVFVRGPQQQRHDLMGAIERHGNAVVASVYYRGASRGAVTTPFFAQSPVITLRLPAGETEANATEIMQVGEMVNVTYRIGKSGKIYIDSLTAAK